MRKAALFIAVGVAAVSLLVSHATSETNPVSAFDRMKNLVGTWTAIDPAGGPMTNTVRMVSNGTAIEEVFESGTKHQMVTLYSREGDRLAMVHLCEIGNQPRMETRAGAANSDTFEFFFTGATNLANPEDLHMHHMLLHIVDKDHFDETWTIHANGKDEEHGTFHFIRKSS